MNISSVTSLDEAKQDDYLRINELIEGNTYKKVAYVMSSSAKISKTNTGFAKFFVKDVNSNVCCAFLFNVADFAKNGIKISQFKGKPVILQFVPEIYNGSMTLIIDGVFGIQEYTGLFDRAAFVGKVDYNEPFIEKAMEAHGINWELPNEYKYFTDDSIGQGRIGAFVKIIEIALRTLISYSTLMSAEELKDLLDIFLVTVQAKFRVLQSAQKLEIISDNLLFDTLYDQLRLLREHKYYPIISDCLRSVIGVSKPQHLYSHLITEAWNSANKALQFILTDKGLVAGMSANVGGEVLLKY